MRRLTVLAEAENVEHTSYRMCLNLSGVVSAAAAKMKVFRLWKVAHFQNSANEEIGLFSDLLSLTGCDRSGQSFNA
jgi:hypothetical protein